MSSVAVLIVVSCEVLGAKEKPQPCGLRLVGWLGSLEVDQRSAQLRRAAGGYQ